MSQAHPNHHKSRNELLLIQTVQKQHRTLAFPPIEAKFASTVCGASPEAQAILAENVNGDEGDFGLSIQEIAKAFDLLQPAKTQSKKIGLYSWLRDAITTATTRSVYGPMNPYDDKTVADAFW